MFDAGYDLVTSTAIVIGESMNSNIFFSCRSIQSLVIPLVLGVGLTLSSLALAETSNSEPASAEPSMPPGAIGFNGDDRLAITNLVAAHFFAIEQKLPDLLAQVVAPEFTAEYFFPGTPPLKIVGRDQYREVSANRFVTYQQDGIQRRHIITAPLFVEQTTDSARFFVNILNCTTTKGQHWHPFASAISEFRAIKRGGVWYLYSQIETVDAPMDIPLNKVLPGMADSEQK